MTTTSWQKALGSLPLNTLMLVYSKLDEDGTEHLSTPLLFDDDKEARNVINEGGVKAYLIIPDARELFAESEPVQPRRVKESKRYA